MKPEDVHKMDQGMAALAEMVPPYLRRMYVNCISEGFTEDQAMRIVLRFVSNLRA